MVLTAVAGCHLNIVLQPAQLVGRENGALCDALLHRSLLSIQGCAESAHKSRNRRTYDISADLALKRT